MVYDYLLHCNRLVSSSTVIIITYYLYHHKRDSTECPQSIYPHRYHNMYIDILVCKSSLWGIRLTLWSNQCNDEPVIISGAPYPEGSMQKLTIPESVHLWWYRLIRYIYTTGQSATVSNKSLRLPCIIIAVQYLLTHTGHIVMCVCEIVITFPVETLVTFI